MIAALIALLASLRAGFRSRVALHLEILALRHQLAVYQRGRSRVRTKVTDRLLWAWLSRRATAGAVIAPLPWTAPSHGRSRDHSTEPSSR